MNVAGNAHPLVRFLYLQMMAEGVGSRTLARRAGLGRGTLRQWATAPGGIVLQNIEAAIAVFGYELRVVPSDAAPPAVVGIAPLRPGRLTERIVGLLADNGQGGWTVTDLRTALRLNGVEARDRRVRNAVAYLKRRGKIRLTDGGYVLAGEVDVAR